MHRFLLAAFFTVLFASAGGGALPSEPAVPAAPPAANPHPPQTAADRARVAFGALALRTLLMPDGPRGTQVALANEQTLRLDWSADCLRSTPCVHRDPQQFAYITQIRSAFGPLREFRHVHIIPWSWQRYDTIRRKLRPTESVRPSPAPSSGDQPPGAPAKNTVMEAPRLAADEYLLHTYARFDNDAGWYHVDLVLAEDGAGTPRLRRFFIMAMPASGSMPPDVVCRFAPSVHQDSLRQLSAWHAQPRG